MEKILEKIKKSAEKKLSAQVLMDFYYVLEDEVKEHGGADYVDYMVWLAEKARYVLSLPGGTDADWLKAYEFYEQVLLMAAPWHFDSYCLYLEWDRDPEKRFYEPRRKVLKQVADKLQKLSEGKTKILCISMPPGAGKALANDTPIMTRKGFKRHGDLCVGDEVVGLDGKYKKVLAVHPKCMLDCEVTFTNGEKIICHENHEWLVYDRNKQKDRVISTKEIEESVIERGIPGKRGHRYSFLLPIMDAMCGEEIELPLKPYTLGVWLGDGTNKNPTITNPKCDTCIIDSVVADGYPIRWKTEHKDTGVMQYGFGFRKCLQSMGMCFSRTTCVKYIPDVYLKASEAQRLELLAGLIDTDGTKCGNKYQISTVNRVLCDGIMALISTFDWRCHCHVEKAKMSTSGIEGKKDVYIIGFNPSKYIPCRVERKRMTELSKPRRISIASVKRIEPIEGNCISVEDEYYRAGLTMLPTHNSTIAIFYLTWMAGKYPNEPMLTGSHSNAFITGCYQEVLRVLDGGEYRWHEVFPLVSILRTNAKDTRIDLSDHGGKGKRFETLEFTSVGSGNAGLYRASRLLYCDDLVSGIEVALSKERLDKLWEIYTTDLRQRKIGDHCGELHIATRWSVHDIIGRLERQYEGDPMFDKLVLPAVDEHDESNFDYDYGVGFSSEFYHEQREIMDEVSWLALYMNQPIEREGLLYHKEQLNYYFDLPSEEPDGIIAVCDTKDKGKDYCVLPVGYKYGNRVYIEDILCDNGNPDVIDERIAQKLLHHKVRYARFESNAAGGRVAKTAQDNVKKGGGSCNISTKFSTANKETRIIMAYPYVMEHFYFKDSTLQNKEYKTAMAMLCSWTMAGRNSHDDVPDAIAMLADFDEKMSHNYVEVFKRPF